MGSPALGDRRECWGAGSGETRGPKGGDTLEERESPGETNLKKPVAYKASTGPCAHQTRPAIDGGLTRFLPLALRPPPPALRAGRSHVWSSVSTLAGRPSLLQVLALPSPSRGALDPLSPRTARPARWGQTQTDVPRPLW